MALIPCPECQREVSTKALACPQCALPYPGKSGLSTNSNSNQLSTCPDCGSQVSKQAAACHHCGLALQGAWTHQATIESSIEETWLCPHCAKPYTRQVKRREEAIENPQEAASIIQSTKGLQIVEKATEQDYKDTDIESILEDIRSSSPLWQDDSASEGVSPSPYPGGSRSPLWQDLSARKDVASSQYHPDRRRRSIIVGLIIFVVVAISIGLGTIWKLQGINPLEALVSWLM